MSLSFDSSKPNIARMYDYWLGGKDNYAVDRQAAEAVAEFQSRVGELALANKKFQTRAITHIAEQGVRQFLDIGSGLPTSPVRVREAAPLWLPTHAAAQAVDPSAVVAYVDNDPVAVSHSQALLPGGSTTVVAVTGDMTDPKAILAGEEILAVGFDLDAPACVVLACVLHFVDAGTAREIVFSFVRALAPGSYLVVSVGYGRGRAGAGFASTYNAQGGPQIYAHSLEEIIALFAGLDLILPGLTEVSAWRPGWPESELPGYSAMIIGGVGRTSLAARQGEVLPDIGLNIGCRLGRVDRSHEFFALEQLDQRFGLVVIFVYPHGQRVRVVVSPGDQRSAAHIADVGDLRPVIDQVVVQPAQ
jgi:SAM-dependent methyltransferase